MSLGGGGRAEVHNRGIVTRKRRRLPLHERVARDVSIALVAGVAIGLTLTFAGLGEALGLVGSNPEQDWHAYFGAAERLRSGGLLYPPVPDPSSESVYRYAPWFALLWVPLTYLPRDAVGVAWVLTMFACSAIALWPLLSSGRLGLALLAGLFAPYMASASIHGNVQPLMIMALVRTVDERAGPIVIGIAGSLKGFPLIYAVRYALLRQWSRFFVAVAVTVVLVAPIFLFDLSNYPVTPGPLAGLWAISPIAWAVGLLAGFAALIRFSRGRAGWFAASFAVVMAIPRLLYVDMTFLLVTGRDVMRPRAAPPPRP
jgi:hypothetical protein